MDKIIFRRGTIGLMIIFGLGVVTPLLVLKAGFWELGVNFSIALAAFCVFSLIPFLKDVNSILKYEIGAENLYTECINAINSGYETETSGIIFELGEIVKGAVKESCEDAVVNIIFYLSQIGKKCAEKRWVDETWLVIDNLTRIGVYSVGRIFTWATKPTVRGLKNIGVMAAKNRLEGAFLQSRDFLAEEAINGLKKIGIKAAEIKADEKGFNKIYGGSARVAEDLKTACMGVSMGGIIDICMKLEDKHLAVNELWWVGAFVTKYLPKNSDIAIQSLKEIEEDIGKGGLMYGAKNCTRGYPQLEASLEDFKEQYNKNT
ncbi:MAG: hypothetical protein PHD13_03880 [Methanocellales archaeon]|nr:hypothetical protein [Methanocellales archaeon]MDD3291194.1 hypothetical protein [Methanocellales archaeon]MDD5235294.1 hypothetical protein [Methanocellales archaeon]MDD5484550.1 hypothetical protein [Methanocellales archaeon]